MRIIALSNQKGGVGKTTTSVTLSACLADAGHRVCVLDLDPQANATSHLGFELEAYPSVYEPLLTGKPVDNLPLPTKYENLSLIPADRNLSGVEVELARTGDHLSRLQGLLNAYRPNAPFDFMFIDCPPSLGVLMTSALAASDEILVPVQTEYFGIEGIAKMLQVIDEIKSVGANPNVIIEGMVMTMADTRTNLTNMVINDVRSEIGSQAYTTVIPRNVRLSEAPSYGQTVLDYDRNSKGAEAYRALSQEFLERHAVPA